MISKYIRMYKCLHNINKQCALNKLQNNKSLSYSSKNIKYLQDYIPVK